MTDWTLKCLTTTSAANDEEMPGGWATCRFPAGHLGPHFAQSVVQTPEGTAMPYGQAVERFLTEQVACETCGGRGKFVGEHPGGTELDDVVCPESHLILDTPSGTLYAEMDRCIEWNWGEGPGVDPEWRLVIDLPPSWKVVDDE